MVPGKREREGKRAKRPKLCWSSKLLEHLARRAALPPTQLWLHSTPHRQTSIVLSGIVNVGMVGFVTLIIALAFTVTVRADVGVFAGHSRAARVAGAAGLEIQCTQDEARATHSRFPCLSLPV